MKQPQKPVRSRKAKPRAAQPATTMPKPSVPSPSVPSPARLISKTPMFAAMHASRYQRQSLIKEIEDRTETTLVCYVSGENCQIEVDDTIGIVELLHNIPLGQSIDLLLHTTGGDIDAAEKLIELFRGRLGEGGRLRVIVPNAAKSAGTLMALGADEIVMSDSSELGMIDPQFVLKDERGNDICTSVVAYLDAYREHAESVRKDPSDPVAQAMLSHFDPVIVRKFQGFRDRARDIAMRMLNRQGAASTWISEALMDLERWKSHNQMIGHEDAHQLGLNVTYLNPDDSLWQMYWHLYCLHWLEVGKNKKIFESVYVSQVFER